MKFDTGSRFFRSSLENEFKFTQCLSIKFALYANLKYVINEHKTNRNRWQASTGFFLSLLLYPEHGSDMFL
jgi:hypothetical protein